MHCNDHNEYERSGAAVSGYYVEPVAKVQKVEPAPAPAPAPVVAVAAPFVLPRWAEELEAEPKRERVLEPAE